MSAISKIPAILFLIGLYVLVLILINVLHFQFLTVNVVLYDTLVDVLLSGVIVTAIYVLMIRGRLGLSDVEGALSIVTGFLIGVIFAISIPTVIDRSLSIYILEKLEQRGGGIRKSAFVGVFKDEYMPEHRLVDIRLTEQLNSGTIKIVGDCVILTYRGRLIAGFTRFYRTRLLPKHREIMGQYSDTLTDPFRASRSSPAYTCSSSDR